MGGGKSGTPPSDWCTTYMLGSVSLQAVAVLTERVEVVFASGGLPPPPPPPAPPFFVLALV